MDVFKCECGNKRDRKASFMLHLCLLRCLLHLLCAVSEREVLTPTLCVWNSKQVWHSQKQRSLQRHRSKGRSSHTMKNQTFNLALESWHLKLQSTWGEIHKTTSLSVLECQDLEIPCSVPLSLPFFLVTSTVGWWWGWLTRNLFLKLP